MFKDLVTTEGLKGKSRAFVNLNLIVSVTAFPQINRFSANYREPLDEQLEQDLC